MASWLRLGRSRKRIRTLLGALTGFTLLQLASRSISPVSAVFGIGEQRFKFEGLIDLGSLGLEDVNGMVAAMGDLDGEQLQGARYIRVED